MNALEEFSERFSAFVGVEYAVPFWKARVALYALLRALGVGRGDEVILPGYTCVMDVNPIMYVGATPRYADIDPATYNVDPVSVRALVSDRTRLILAQHTYGIPAPLKQLKAIARDCGAWLVEDCCLAVGSRYGGEQVGTYGDAAYWSFQWNKVFTTGLGGMATTSDRKLAEDLTEVCKNEAAPPTLASAYVLAAQRVVHTGLIWPRTAALARVAFRALTDMGLAIGSSDPTEFRPDMPSGFFTTMSSGQARAGLRALSRLRENLAHRRELADFYAAHLQEKGWAPLTVPAEFDPVLVGYPVQVQEKDRVLKEAPKRFIEMGSWFESPLHPKETPLESYGYKSGMCPIAEKASAEVVMLPTHPRTTKRDAERVIHFLTSTTGQVT